MQDMTMQIDSYDHETGALSAMFYGPVTDPDSEERGALNRIAHEIHHAHHSVDVIDGWQAPILRGQSYHWTTLSGKTIVRHPNAYRWPKLYHRSTLRVEVGRAWLVAWRRAGGVFRSEYAAGIASSPTLRALTG